MVREFYFLVKSTTINIYVRTDMFGEGWKWLIGKGLEENGVCAKHSQRKKMEGGISVSG